MRICTYYTGINKMTLEAGNTYFLDQGKKGELILTDEDYGMKTLKNLNLSVFKAK